MKWKDVNLFVGDVRSPPIDGLVRYLTVESASIPTNYS